VVIFRTRRVEPADQREEKAPWMAPPGLNPGPEGGNRMLPTGGRVLPDAELILCNTRN
jgi:hypothetical protein